MSDLRSFVNLIIKQTCRNFAYEYERGWRNSAEDYSTTNKYTLEFLKLLHENPDKHIHEILGVSSASNDSSVEANNKITFSDVDKENLLTFLNTVHSLKPRSCKLWIDLEHYMLYVYRNVVSANPVPTNQHLSKSIRSQMKSIISELMIEDKNQLYLRIFALLREYVIFAHWHFNQITDKFFYLPKLFNYHEAFMNAAESLRELFKDFEVVLKEDYTLTWLDFNLCIFMHYFYELNDVQTKLFDMENGIDLQQKSVSLYYYNLLKTRFSDLHGKWFTKRLGVKTNTKETDNKMDKNSSQLENEILTEVQNILSQNFWIRRSPEKKSLFESKFVESRMFMLLGATILKISEPNLDKTGQCICEHCLIIKYKYVLAKKAHISTSRQIPCQICGDTVVLDNLQEHINEHYEGESSSNDSDGEEIAINGQVIKTNVMSEIKALFNSNAKKELQIQIKNRHETDGNIVSENKTNGYLDDEGTDMLMENNEENSLACVEDAKGNRYGLQSNGNMTNEDHDCVNPEHITKININEFSGEIDENFDLLATDDLAVNTVPDGSVGNWEIHETSSSLDPNDRSTDVDNDLSSDFDYDMELPNFSSAKSIIDYVGVNELPNFNDFVENPNYNDFVTFQIALDNHIKNKKEGKANDALDALYFQEFLKHSMYFNQNQKQGQNQSLNRTEKMETNLLAENIEAEPTPKMFLKPVVIPKELDNEQKEMDEKVEILKPKLPLPNLELPAVNVEPNNKNQPTLPCGHSCKHGEEVKSDLKKVCQEICDHHSKDSKKCDCTYCEVFGTTRVQANPKDTLTRNRLRIRLLNQRKAKSKPPTTEIAAVPPARPEPTIPNPISSQPNVLSTLANDLTTKCATGKKKKGTGVPEELEQTLHYIEGEDRSIIAEKKAAKKARQRQKKEEERLKKEEEERKQQEEEKLIERMRTLQLAKVSAEQEKNSKASKKERKKNAKAQQLTAFTPEQSNVAVYEETIPALVTIQRSLESNTLLTIQFQDRTQTQEELLASLVRQSGTQIQTSQPNITESKKAKKNKQQQPQQQSLPGSSISKVKKSKSGTEKPETASVIANEVKITLSIASQSLPSGSLGQRTASAQLPSQSSSTHILNASTVTASLDKENSIFRESKKNKKGQNKDIESKPGSSKKSGKDDNRNKDSQSCEISNLRLPPGITITKVNGPVTPRNYKTTDLQTAQQSTANATSVPVSKSGVIIVDTEKLIQQTTTPPESNSGAVSAAGRKSKKKNKKKQGSTNTASSQQTSGQDIVTLKNPIFQPYHSSRSEAERVPDLNQYNQASIFRNDNGMVTIRSSRLQQSLNTGTPIPNLLSDLKPVIGPDVATPYVAPCSFPEPNRISPFNAQEILSGLPGIEITKVDKCSARNDLENRKSCQAAEVSIIPTNANSNANANNSNVNAEKFNLDKEDWHYDSVFTPKDVLEDDMDADEIELEAFKRFCQQSVPPKKKEKVAHLNVKDIVLKKKNDQNSV